ncbi:MAG TPA: tRNA pseudouridine(38-40) synthase TruA, partial [Burkholderiales bacterium]|nr:tRNA pseudouridine(38-40) synthase TruA [Burkholderiales bacterium]
LALGLEYDGRAFCGWQTQPERCAVQDKLEAALAQLAGERISTVCAGRTDAGVHALGQVVHFDTGAARPLSAWVRGANALLPPHVAVNWAHAVRGDFHARYSARERGYRYVLLNRAVRPAAERGRVGWFHLPLDLSHMQAAAAHLIGEHDFSAFRSSECQARSPVRDLRRLDIERVGDYVVFDFAANAYLHHMVRNIVGALVYVGKGKHPPEWMGALLAGRDRTRAAPTFDAAGLYLTRVVYDDAWGLPGASDAALARLALLTEA